MTDTQAVWLVIWKQAARDPAGREPFEIDAVVPEVAGALRSTEQAAGRIVDGLLKELERLPDGRQYFAVEGNAIVPLPEFAASPKDETAALEAYPFEI